MLSGWNTSIGVAPEISRAEARPMPTTYLSQSGAEVHRDGGGAAAGYSVRRKNTAAIIFKLVNHVGAMPCCSSVIIRPEIEAVGV